MYRHGKRTRSCNQSLDLEHVFARVLTCTRDGSALYLANHLQLYRVDLRAPQQQELQPVPGCGSLGVGYFQFLAFWQNTPKPDSELYGPTRQNKLMRITLPRSAFACSPFLCCSFRFVSDRLVFVFGLNTAALDVLQYWLQPSGVWPLHVLPDMWRIVAEYCALSKGGTIHDHPL
jgi:hypothetical protein